jgi:hypothetical protein
MLVDGAATWVLLTDRTWAALAAFVDPTYPLFGHYTTRVRIFTSRRRAQAFRHDVPGWQELGIGIVPL